MHDPSMQWTHGGARPKAGRKHVLDRKVRITYRLNRTTRDTINIIAEHMKCSATEVIEASVLMYKKLYVEKE